MVFADVLRNLIYNNKYGFAGDPAFHHAYEIPYHLVDGETVQVEGGRLQQFVLLRAKLLVDGPELLGCESAVALLFPALSVLFSVEPQELLVTPLVLQGDLELSYPIVA